MNEPIKNVVKRIVFMPHDFNKGDKSMLTLLNESGYMKMHDQIGEQEINEVLGLHPDSMTEWIQLSADNRSSEKWVIMQLDNGQYHVGHWPGGKDFEAIFTSDPLYACSAFIKRHIEHIRILAKQ